MKLLAGLSLALMLLAGPAMADGDGTPQMWGHKKDVCYRLTGNYRVVRTVCNAHVWPNSEFRGGDGSTYSLGELLDLGKRFDGLARSLKRLFR